MSAMLHHLSFMTHCSLRCFNCNFKAHGNSGIRPFDLEMAAKVTFTRAKLCTKFKLSKSCCLRVIDVVQVRHTDGRTHTDSGTYKKTDRQTDTLQCVMQRSWWKGCIIQMRKKPELRDVQLSSIGYSSSNKALMR